MGLNEFTLQYMVTALWSSTDEHGEPLDGMFDLADIAPETRAAMEADCKAFYEAHNGLWDDDETAGHDFWLTRNGHGCGFWDGDYPEHGDTLTDFCKSYGTVDLYVDEGRIHAF